jgi:hypothetical protein
VAFAQVPVNPWIAAAQPPVPSDPLEMAAGNAQPVQDVIQRAAAVELLRKAQLLSNVRRSPYDLKTRFISVGSSPSDGSWQLEDASPGLGIYRWTAQGPSYSAVNLFTNSLVYSNMPPSGIPLRLAQVRAAIFFNYPVYGPRASLRTATGNLNGAEVTCVLVSHRFNIKPASGSRRWDEYESCIDPRSGLLMSYSPAPGLYILYDYSAAKHFHERIIPGKFTITQAGQPIIEAQVESVVDPASPDSGIYTPAGLNPLGVGSLMTAPWNIQTTFFQGTAAPNYSNAQFVVLHGMLSPDGHFADSEILASSNSGLNQQAVQYAMRNRQRQPAGETGATPQSHEIIFTTLFPN